MEPIGTLMSPHQHKPWWELPAAPPPYDDALDAEREHLRAELARAWRERRAEHERRRGHQAQGRGTLPLPPSSPHAA
jgi:hypothetical protein